MVTLSCTQVNAKISDYGIACFATASGLTLDTGTTGHKAPEVMKGRSLGTYNKEVRLAWLRSLYNPIGCHCRLIFTLMVSCCSA